MLKKLLVGTILTSSFLIGQEGILNFFKYSTYPYGSFSLNAPRHQDDRFAIVGGLSKVFLRLKELKEN